MKNRVNFYQAEYHPKLRLLSLSLVIVCWALTLIFSLSAYFYFDTKQQQTKTEIAGFEQKKQQQLLLIEELQSALEQKKPDPQLLNQVEQNQKLISLKKRILNELNGQKTTQSSGFSRLMLDLAEHHQLGLWLTHITLDGANVTIQGSATESAAIPQWVNVLAKTDYFKGQEFANTRLFRDDNQQLHFVLATNQTPSEESELIHE